MITAQYQWTPALMKLTWFQHGLMTYLTKLDTPMLPYTLLEMLLYALDVQVQPASICMSLPKQPQNT